MRQWIYLAAYFFLCIQSYSHAEASDTVGSDSGDSPWLFVPIITTDPKIGTSLGLLSSYLYRFDPESTSSMFGAAVYSSTDSKLAGLYARMYFDNDSKRLNFFAGGGRNQ